MPASSRRRSRIVAFQTLFELDTVQRHDVHEALQRHIDDARLAEDAGVFATDLVEACARTRRKSTP